MVKRCVCNVCGSSHSHSPNHSTPRRAAPRRAMPCPHTHNAYALRQRNSPVCTASLTTLLALLPCAAGIRPQPRTLSHKMHTTLYTTSPRPPRLNATHPLAALQQPGRTKPRHDRCCPVWSLRVAAADRRGMQQQAGVVRQQRKAAGRCQGGHGTAAAAVVTVGGAVLLCLLLLLLHVGSSKERLHVVRRKTTQSTPCTQTHRVGQHGR